MLIVYSHSIKVNKSFGLLYKISFPGQFIVITIIIIDDFQISWHTQSLDRIQIHVLSQFFVSPFSRVRDLDSDSTFSFLLLVRQQQYYEEASMGLSFLNESGHRSTPVWKRKWVFVLFVI